MHMSTRSPLDKRILFSIFVPPLSFAPIGMLLLLLDVNVSIIRDGWYLSIFISCILMVMREKTPLSQIGLTKQKLGLSLLLSGIWEITTYTLLGILPFLLVTGKMPTLVQLNGTMVTSAFHFMLVGLAEETWMRGLLLKRLREWRSEGPALIMWSSIIFILLHLPASSLMIIQDVSLLPLLLLSWSTLFVWSAGLAVIALKTGNLFGPIIIHSLDDFVSKGLYPLQI